MNANGKALDGVRTAAPWEPTVTVVCDAPGGYHDRYGRTVLGTYARRGDPDLPGCPAPGGHWEEVRTTRHRTRRKYRDWRAGSADGDLFAGSPTPGLRPETLVYLRGNEPASDHSDAERIRQALSTGMWSGARGTRPADARDLAGRAKLDLLCPCGLALRVSPPAPVWEVFDILVTQRVRRISLPRLIQHLDALDASRDG